MERVKYLILGGGVTGLSVAGFLGSKDCLVVERDSSVGGYCRSTLKDGFVWDRAGHFFHFRDPAIRDYLLERMSPGSVRETVKQARIHYAGRLIDFPFQQNIHQLPKDEFLDCLYDFYHRQACPERSRRNAEATKSFRDMVYARFGRSIAEKFLIPYNRKLHACDLDILDADAMGRFFPQVTMDDVVRSFKARDDHSYNATFLYPEGGAVQFVHALLRDLDPGTICTDEEVRGIQPDENTVETSRRRIRYQYLISSIPFPRFLELLHWRADTSCLTWSKVLVFNLGFDAKGPHGIHWIYFPEDRYRFYRVGFYDNLLGSERMSLYVEIGLEKDRPVHADQELETALRGLREAEIVQRQNLVSSETLVLDPAYVHITKPSRQLFQEADRSLRSIGIYTIGRYGGWKYCSIEDNIIEAKMLAEDLTR
jgi:protoporphyrinogen oxidase